MESQDCLLPSFSPAPLRIRLEAEAEELSKGGDTDSERLMDIYERLEELDATTAETKAARILFGLGRKTL